MTRQANSLGRRLRRLPLQLLLSLINATALLVIAAAVLVIIAINRLENAGPRLTNAVTTTALANIDVTPEELKTRYEAAVRTTELLKARLSEPGVVQDSRLLAQLTELNGTLAKLEALAGNISTAQPDIIAQGAREIGNTVTSVLLSLRNCELPESSAPETRLPALGS